MKVRALKPGYFTYLREEGEVFVVPDGTKLGDSKGQNPWMEEVPEETPTTATYKNGEKRIECSHCGLVVKSKFCGECGTPSEVSEKEATVEKRREETIQAITGKKPAPKRVAGRPRKADAEQAPGEEI